MKGQEPLFDTNPYHDPEYRVEDMGEHPPITHEQFIAFTDELMDQGLEDCAIRAIREYQDGEAAWELFLRYQRGEIDETSMPEDG